jgi:probable rRNA maturation factor
VKILIKGKTRIPRIKTGRINRLISVIIKNLKIRKSSELELSLYFTDDKEIRKLNRRYRNKDKSTDVLSFPQEKPVLGDIVISIQTIKKQARSLDLTFEEEFYYVLTHGVLHLLGLNHEGIKYEKTRMSRIHKKIMNDFYAKA